MQHCLLPVVLLLVDSCVMSKKFGFISIVCLSKLHSIKPHLGYCSVTHLCRCDAVILRRLHIGHTRVTHKYLLSGESTTLRQMSMLSNSQAYLTGLL